VSLAGLLLLFFGTFPAEVAGATAQPQIQSQPTPQPTPQPSARSLALTYEVYAGGLHIFSFDVNLSLRPQGYRIAAAGSTRGITGVFYKWDVSLTAEGHSFQPARYVTVNGGRQAAKTMQLDFIKGGSFTVTRNPPEPVDESDEEGKLPSSLPANIADPLSAGLIASRTLAETGSCEQIIPVFDGKRRYNLLLHYAGVGTVPKSRLSVYHGPAIRCGFTMERISGFKKQRRYASQWDEDKDEPPILWVAKIRENMPPIPVRFTGAVSLGSIVIHLARVEPGPELAGTEP
jgi:hypothetical protein